MKFRVWNIMNVNIAKCQMFYECIGVAKVKSQLVALLFLYTQADRNSGKTEEKEEIEEKEEKEKKNENKLIETTEMNCWLLEHFGTLRSLIGFKWSLLVYHSLGRWWWPQNKDGWSALSIHRDQPHQRNNVHNFLMLLRDLHRREMIIMKRKKNSKTLKTLIHKQCIGVDASEWRENVVAITTTTNKMDQTEFSMNNFGIWMAWTGFSFDTFCLSNRIIIFIYILQMSSCFLQFL